ncbi:MAG: hypothetical protein BRC30_03615 [Nanohaloarchaea archaeon SW_7_46_7]|nr:MAG: hypothetical protein BRC30_03615 [Nanohaloarchaea archaeon SW_7_46_7]
MDFREKNPLNSLEGFQKDVAFAGITLLLVGAVVGVGNYTTADEPVRVGMVEVTTECVGLDAGACLGIQRREHTTYNYENYTEAEEGTENYYRRVEAELMVQAYNICSEDIKGMEWTSEASYDNRTGSEWMENENVTLLPCDSTFYRTLK